MKLVTFQRRFTPYSPTSGRMRYAPTPVRSNSNEYHQNTSSKICRIIIPGRRFTTHSPPWERMRYAPTVFRLKSNEYTQYKISNPINWSGCYDRTSVGAYRIRPPWQGTCSCSMKLEPIQRQFTPYSRTWGRMRYAHTFVRLKTNDYCDNTSSKIRHFIISGRQITPFSPP